MLGLVGFIKKKLELDGKLPDKWKDAGKDEPDTGDIVLKVSEDGNIIVPAGTYRVYNEMDKTTYDEVLTEDKVMLFADAPNVDKSEAWGGPFYIYNQDNYLSLFAPDEDSDPLDATPLGYIRWVLTEDGDRLAVEWSATKPSTDAK